MGSDAASPEANQVSDQLILAPGAQREAADDSEESAAQKCEVSHAVHVAVTDKKREAVPTAL